MSDRTSSHDPALRAGRRAALAKLRSVLYACQVGGVITVRRAVRPRRLTHQIPWPPPSETRSWHEAFLVETLTPLVGAWEIEYRPGDFNRDGGWLIPWPDNDNLFDNAAGEEALRETPEPGDDQPGDDPVVDPDPVIVPMPAVRSITLVEVDDGESQPFHDDSRDDSRRVAPASEACRGAVIELLEMARKRLTLDEIADHCEYNDICSRTTVSRVVPQMLKDGLLDNVRGRNGSGGYGLIKRRKRS